MRVISVRKHEHMSKYWYQIIRPPVCVHIKKTRSLLFENIKFSLKTYSLVIKHNETKAQND